MKILIAIVLLLIWGYSYFRFRQKMSYFSVMHDYLSTIAKDNPTRENMLRLSGACIMIQHYKDALELYQKILSEYPTPIDKDKIDANIAFCNNPVPGVHKPKNFNKSWWHNFVLVRLGKKRYSFLTQEDYTATEALIRIAK